MEEFRLDTPEAVDIVYDVAGIGTRFLAALIDLLAMAGLGIVLAMGCIALYASGGVASTAAIILFISLSFLLIWGYYIVFETLWNGQTPGKRAMKIRVLKTSGYPIGFVEAALRNVVRLVDFLPVGYGIGVLTMFVSTRARRLGDFAAGTIVVKERTAVSIRDVAAPAARTHSGLSVPLGAIDPDELQWDLRALSAHDLQIVSAYLDRATSLDPKVRNRVGGEIAGRVAAHVGAREPFDPVRFLQRVVELRDAQTYEVGRERS